MIQKQEQEIVERAKVHAKRREEDEASEKFLSHYISYIKGAHEQDPISRADEREKVIEKACECFDAVLKLDIEIFNRLHSGWTGLFELEKLHEKFKQEMEK